MAISSRPSTWTRDHAIGGGVDADEEATLIDAGSAQADLWGSTSSGRTWGAG
jgi:hypothetical protein